MVARNEKLNPIEKVVFELDYEGPRRGKGNFIVRVKEPVGDRRISFPTAYLHTPEAAEKTAEAYAKFAGRELASKVEVTRSPNYEMKADEF